MEKKRLYNRFFKIIVWIPNKIDYIRKKSIKIEYIRNRNRPKKFNIHIHNHNRFLIL